MNHFRLLLAFHLLLLVACVQCDSPKTRQPAQPVDHQPVEHVQHGQMHSVPPQPQPGQPGDVPQTRPGQHEQYVGGQQQVHDGRLGKAVDQFVGSVSLKAGCDMARCSFYCRSQCEGRCRSAYCRADICYYKCRRP